MTNTDQEFADFVRFRQEVDTYRRQVDAAEQQTATDFALRHRTQVRGHVTRVLVYFFVGYLAVLVGLVIFGSAVDGSTFGVAAWQDKANFLVEVLKVGILPVVTFILGHYFGSEGR